jgi:tRNA threonylcarbamoyladenosine biosynthesis protein TsaE
MKVTVKSLDDLPALAAALLSKYDHKTMAFYGEMGVGKTTFIKCICERLGVEKKEICSPTYSLVNEYITNNKDTVYHFDFYRIKKEQEAYDMGYEDYFYSDAYSFIEWPEKIANLLPENTLKISIKLDGTNRFFVIEES